MGRKVSVYSLPSGHFTAFGYSAYRICCSMSGMGRAVYSRKLEMPYLELSPEDAAFVQKGETSVVDIIKYNEWVAGLRVEEDGCLICPNLDSGYTIVDGMSPAGRVVKRLFDIVASAAAIVVLSPLMLVLWIVVRVEDGGPAIYRQRRVGRFGREFTMFKFRSLKRESVELGPTLSPPESGRDPRISRCGLFMRKHHLDELPQLWNVFRGDMSVIGPRPERMYFVRRLCAMDTGYFNLFQVRPGLVSIAYLEHGYADTPEKMIERARAELSGLPLRSVAGDVKTMFAVFRFLL